MLAPPILKSSGIAPAAPAPLKQRRGWRCCPSFSRSSRDVLSLGTIGLALCRRKAVQTTEVTEVEPEAKVAKAPKQDAFNWEKQWYPVLPLSMLHGSGPEALKLLNKDLVLWKDADGKWRCTSGICPHRLAPLAHGRVNANGELMCRFHGWCFKGDGSCSKVPMAEGDEEAKAKLVGQEVSKLISYPTKTKKGLLFVWPHAGSDEEADGKDPFVPEELSESPNWSCFDVPAGWRVWLEQSWDPSHAPFLHQYALPNFAPEYASAMEPFQIEDLGDEGLKVRHGGYMQSNMGMKADRRFMPPCANSTSYLYPDGRIIGFNFYFVPTEPGKVRQITTSYFVPSKDEEKQKSNLSGNMMQMSKVVLKGRSLDEASSSAPKRSLKEVVLTWCEGRWPELSSIRRGLATWKLLQGLLGDQDNTVLSFQDSVGLPAVQQGHLRQPRVSKKYGGPASEYLLETHADALVARFGAWIAQRGGGPFGSDHGNPPQPVTPVDPEQVFDRWMAHTSFSKDAQAALSFLARLADLAERLVVLSCLLAALALALGALRLTSLPLLGAALGTWGGRKARRKAQGFLSALPLPPALPKRKLWE